MTQNDFVIKHTSHGDWIVHVKDRENHSHFKRREGCSKLIEFIVKGKMPYKEYFRTAAKRILTEEEYMMLQSKRKDMYVNINKGVIR